MAAYFREYRFYVYIVASLSGTLYVGMSRDLDRRITEHKLGEIEGFTKKYGVNRLVYFERFQYVRNAIAREKQIKSWRREKKVALIEEMNPSWKDLAPELGGRR
jgi:putative endonuclease